MTHSGTPYRLAYHLIRIIYLSVEGNRVIHYSLSKQKSQGHCELRMQDTEINSMTALTGGGRPDGWFATLRTEAKRQLGYVASHLFSSGPFAELVVVSLISILILRGSG